MFTLQDMTDMKMERLQQHKIQKTVNRTRLKETVFEHFSNLANEKGIRDRVFIVCSEIARTIISDAPQTPNEEADSLLMATSILRKAVLDHDTAFKFDHSFPKSSSEQENSRKILYVSQIAMLNMTSLIVT